VDVNAWLDRAPNARFWRWRLVGDPIPVERTVDAANAVIASLNQMAKTMFGSNRLPPDLHPDTPRTEIDGVERHLHAFVLPEDLDLDGRLDHVAVTVAANLGGGGFTRRGLALLASCPGFWLGRADVRLEPLALSDRCPLGTDATARTWLSVTPFVPPLHRHPPPDQLVLSLESLGLPAPIAVEMIARATAVPAREIPAANFVPTGPALKRWRGELTDAELERRKGAMAYWRLEFADPLTGPLVLGHLCHFGLGRFAPRED
jgi:CRISPR-associated protein Csb2